MDELSIIKMPTSEIPSQNEKVFPIYPRAVGKRPPPIMNAIGMAQEVARLRILGWTILERAVNAAGKKQTAAAGSKKTATFSHVPDNMPNDTVIDPVIRRKSTIVRFSPSLSVNHPPKKDM